MESRDTQEASWESEIYVKTTEKEQKRQSHMTVAFSSGYLRKERMSQTRH